MALVYSERTEPFTGSFDMSKAKATEHYMRHYCNSLYLSFMMKNGTMKERSEASNELAIAERKMKFWKNHHNFEQEVATRASIEAKKQWAI